MRNKERASLVPAAAVIPALLAYIKIAAVKTLVVGMVGILWLDVLDLNISHLARCHYQIFLVCWI
tara:strand:- start:122 stop:316 length:195 start_codon:yes stop_codon:yes gene_type:complete